jgi:hypothetical protein
MTAADPDRRRFLASLGGLAVLTGAARVGYGLLSKGASLPALVVPPGFGAADTARLQRLHARYDAVYGTGGASALRTRVSADINAFAATPTWLELVVQWIVRPGFATCADLLIDAALVGNDDLRRSCAAYLADRPTPLVSAASHGARIIHLHHAETDALAKSYWFALRRRLGV